MITLLTNASNHSGLPATLSVLIIGTLVTVLPTFIGFKNLPIIGIDIAPPKIFRKVLLVMPSLKPRRAIPPVAIGRSSSYFFISPLKASS